MLFNNGYLLGWWHTIMRLNCKWYTYCTYKCGLSAPCLFVFSKRVHYQWWTRWYTAHASERCFFCVQSIILEWVWYLGWVVKCAYIYMCVYVCIDGTRYLLYGYCFRVLSFTEVYVRVCVVWWSEGEVFLACLSLSLSHYWTICVCVSSPIANHQTNRWPRHFFLGCYI